MIVKFIFIILCFMPFAISSTNFCTNNSPCKCVLSVDSVIDLSSVGQIGFPRFFDVKANNSENDYMYSYNPCYSFDSILSHHTVQKNGMKPCINAAACVRSPGGNSGELPEEYAIGIQSEGKFATDDVHLNHISYSVPGTKQTLIVILKCEEHQKNHTLEIGNITDPNNVEMTLISKCACPNLCPSQVPEDPSDEGMSTGSKLLIAFFTITICYFVVGMVWNFCNGAAQGVELIPNYEFWNELPKLIVEGVAFTCSCFGRRTAYGEV